MFALLLLALIAGGLPGRSRASEPEDLRRKLVTFDSSGDLLLSVRARKRLLLSEAENNSSRIANAVLVISKAAGGVAELCAVEFASQVFDLYRALMAICFVRP